MGSAEERADEISRAAEMADIFLRSRKDTLVMTSRELITGKSKSLGAKVMQFMQTELHHLLIIYPPLSWKRFITTFGFIFEIVLLQLLLRV